MSDSEKPIEFTDNYEDLSTDKGFQFKFCCERCGNGYMSTFKTNKIGVLGNLMEAAGSIFGGVLGRVADGAYQVQRAVGGREHDGALREAVLEIRPKFIQCRKCGAWICQSICYNSQANMCKECAPRAEEIETSVRANHVDTQVENDLFLEENARMSAKAKSVAAPCSRCGKKTLGQKFCPNCGTPTAAAVQNCKKCSGKLTPGAAFCGQCGTKVE